MATVARAHGTHRLLGLDRRFHARGQYPQPALTGCPSRAVHPREARKQSRVGRCRSAVPDWSTEDADTWLADTATDLTQRPALCTAVIWHDRCLMRLREGLRVETDRQNQRVDVAVETSPRIHGFASRIPAVVLGALCRTDIRHCCDAAMLRARPRHRALSCPPRDHPSPFPPAADPHRWRTITAPLVWPTRQVRLCPGSTRRRYPLARRTHTQRSGMSTAVAAAGLRCGDASVCSIHAFASAIDQPIGAGMSRTSARSPLGPSCCVVWPGCRVGTGGQG